MADWKLTDLPDLQGTNGIAGYSVLDALGVRIGHISGWVSNSSGRITLLKATVRDWFKSRDYLIPLGAVTLIDDTRRRLQLRQLTKRALMKQCLPIGNVLPEASFLEDLIQYFPNPRPSIMERLAHPATVRPMPSWSRLTVHPDQGDGLLISVDEPTLRPNPHWINIGRLAPPLWKPINYLFGRTFFRKT